MNVEEIRKELSTVINRMGNKFIFALFSFREKQLCIF